MEQSLRSVNMKGKVAIVTGASDGIGVPTAKTLAHNGAHVILACRSLEKAQVVANTIIESTGNKDVEVMKLDLSSFESVRNFARDFREKRLPLHLLINNAAKKIEWDNLNGEINQHAWSVHFYSQSKLFNVMFTVELQHRLKALDFLHITKTVEQGSWTTLTAALLPEYAERGGLYLTNCAPVEPNPIVKDEEQTKKLWEISEKMVGLN